jgi:hypothetical protein
MSYNASTAPERLRPILEALAELHAQILQEKTLKTQSPDDLYDIKNYLYNVGNILLNCVQGNTDENDPRYVTPEVESCIQKLKLNMKPWNVHISVLTPYWIRKMYHQTPFSISKEHIHNLFQNSQYVEENDDDKEKSSTEMS